MNNKIKKARELRKNSTEQEKIMWQLLRNRNFDNKKFRRQYVIGNYIVDFVCREKKLIIEIDGGQHNEENEKIYDEERTTYLNNKGYKIIRFWNNEINENLEGIYETILKQLEEDCSSPHPSPIGDGEII